jgi:hypothetical protein
MGKLLIKSGNDPDSFVSEKSKNSRLDKNCNDDGTSPKRPEFFERSILSSWLRSPHSNGIDPSNCVPEMFSSLSVARQAEKVERGPESCVWSK